MARDIADDLTEVRRVLDIRFPYVSWSVVQSVSKHEIFVEFCCERCLMVYGQALNETPLNYNFARSVDQFVDQITRWYEVHRCPFAQLHRRVARSRGLRGIDTGSCSPHEYCEAVAVAWMEMAQKMRAG